MAINFTGLYVYALQVADIHSVADFYGVPVEHVHEMHDLSSWNPGEQTGAAYKQTLMTTLINMPNVRIVVGKYADLLWSESAALKEINRVQPELRKVMAEETIIVSLKMRENLQYVRIENGKSSVMSIFEELGYRVDTDEDDEHTFMVRVPYSADFTFRYVSDTEIYVNTSRLTPTIVVALADDPWGVAPQLIVGLKTAKELVEIMLAVLNIHRVEFAKGTQYAVGALLGFSGAFGPDDRERGQLDEDGLKIKTEYALGVVGLYLDKVGKVHAGRGSMGGNRPNTVEICKYMQATDAQAWYIPDNRGSFPIRVPVTDLVGDGGPLGIRIEGTEVEFAGSNVKGLLKAAAASHAGSMTVNCVIDAVSPLSQCGQAHISGDVLATAEGRRVVMLGGSHRYPASEFEMALYEAKNSDLKVEVGDVVKFITNEDGSSAATINDLVVAEANAQDNVKAVVATFNGNPIAWSSDDGADEGIVIEVNKKLRIHGAGQRVAGEYEFVLEVHIEAVDRGDAKGRGSVKAMMQTMEAAGVTVECDGQPFVGLHIADGLIKSSKQFKRRFKETGRGRCVVTSVYDKEVFEVTQGIYDTPEYAGKFIFNKDTLEVTTIDDNAVFGEVSFLIESSTVQENVGSAAMTLYQILFLGFTQAGKTLLNKYVVPDMVRRTNLLGYLAALGSMPREGAAPGEGLYLLQGPVLMAYTDTLDLGGMEQKGMTDVQLMDKVHELYPQGVNVLVTDRLTVAIDAGKILQATAPDGLGAGLTGLGETVTRLVRVMADADLKATLIASNPDSVAGLVTAVKVDAAKLAKSGGFGRVYGTRWGVTSKVVASRGIGMGEIHIHAHGRIAKRLARKFKCKVSELDGKSVYVVRHPVIVGYVAKVVLNNKVSKNAMMVNEMEWRRINQGDLDGDTGCAFPVPDELAAPLTAELEVLLPKGDMNLATYGVPAEHPQLEMFGEAVAVDNSADKMINKSKKKSASDWFESIREGVEANTWWTGTGYRVMEGGAIQYALGLTNTRMMMLGAWLYEHKGLAGKPVGESCKRFMQSWIWPLRDRDAVAGMLNNLRLTMQEVEDYQPMGDLNLPHAIIVGNHLNRAVRRGAPDDADIMASPIDKNGSQVSYQALVPLFRVAWLLGRKKLSQATADCVFVASEQMEQLAKVHGFEDSFLYKLCRLVSKQLGMVHALLGDLVDTEAQEDDDVSAWGDEW